MVLQMEGYPLLEASGGPQALELLARLPGPALILLDVMMPYMSGFEVVAALQADEVLARVPVVLIFASEAMVRASSLGLVGLLRCSSKPCASAWSRSLWLAKAVRASAGRWSPAACSRART